MINDGKSNIATIINCENGCRIFIWPDTILSATIRVEKNGKCLWQKMNQSARDLVTALKIAEISEETNVFES
jgi:hypothetical protein